MKKCLMTLPVETCDVTRLDEYLKMLYDAGFEVELARAPLSEDQLIEKWKDVDAHIGGSDKMTARAIASADKLRIISKLGVGYETIDIDAATENGIVVTNTPGVGADAVSEFTLSLMLALSRRVISGNTLVHEGKWARLHGYTLRGKTLGILGLGNIGRKLVTLVSGFNMRILAYDPFPNEAFAKEHNVKFCPLEEVLRNSDIVTIHVPLLPENYHLIGKEQFAMMKKTAIIINAARAELVDEEALCEALKKGEILGAALDVLAGEPRVSLDNPLLSLDNVIITPHMAGSSYEGRNVTIEACVKNVLDFYNGIHPRSTLNPAVFEHLKEV